MTKFLRRFFAYCNIYAHKKAYILKVLIVNECIKPAKDYINIIIFQGYAQKYHKLNFIISFPIPTECQTTLPIML